MTGEVVYFFAFDVANELRLEQVQQQLAGRTALFELPTKHTQPRAVSLSRPLSLNWPFTACTIAGKPIRLDVRLYQFGVVSLVMRVPVQAAALAELTPFHQPALEDGRPLEHLARTICAEICRQLHDAMVHPSELTEPEAYTAFCLYDLAPVSDVPHWLTENRAAIAGLLADLDPARIGAAQIDEIFRLQRALEIGDAVVIDWDAALVVDLSGKADDVLFTLELANLQLEEFRHMDLMLDRFLDRAYDDLERRPFTLLGISSRALRKLRWFRVDLAKLADEVTNTTKLFGDWYLARVYLAARERFHLDQWKNSVEQRLAQLDQMYTVVHTEVAERRMFWLEVLVVLLIAFDLLAIIWRH